MSTPGPFYGPLPWWHLPPSEPPIVPPAFIPINRNEPDIILLTTADQDKIDAARYARQLATVTYFDPRHV